MWSKLRKALVWLLLLAIPTQGIAAATMLYCGPNHLAITLENEAPSVAHAAILTVQAAPHAQTGHSDHGMHHHTASVAHHEESSAIPDQTSPADPLEQSPKTKCSVCALCCNAAAVVSTTLVIPSLGVFSAPIVTVPESPISFVTDGPRRPPRYFLA